MIEPFRADFPPAQLDDLAERLRQARFVPELPGGGDRDLGVPTARLRGLVDHWRHGYDWRAWEAALNRHPQHRTRIDGLWVHFLTSARRDPTPSRSSSRTAGRCRCSSTST